MPARGGRSRMAGPGLCRPIKTAREKIPRPASIPPPPRHMIGPRGEIFLNDRYLFVNAPLPYSYHALEPYIDEQTMLVHHGKHLQTYVDNLNVVLEDYPRLQNLSLEQLIVRAGSLPARIGTPISQNAGGVYNHRFYFNGLMPPSGVQPFGALAGAINRSFGGYDAFRERFTAAAMSVFGSGYAWLVKDRRGNLKIITTPNQDTPLPAGHCPILAIDVWEHAYYLKHFNRRVDYVDDWWNVVNWPEAEARYLACGI